MSMPDKDMSRRTALKVAGIGLGGAATLFAGSPAIAANSFAAAPKDWRRGLADEYLPSGTPFSVRGLQSGLEVWEAPQTGYLIVEATHRTLIEGSADAVSPFAAAVGDLAYLGPAHYYETRGAEGTNLLTREPSGASNVRAAAADAAARLNGVLVASPITAPTDAASASLLTAIAPPAAGNIKNKVPGYADIVLAHLYPNSEGICGWIAGSIITRYWHARSTARKLLPTAYRSGTNMTASPNFATYLQGSSGNSSWARDVKDRLIWNANKQGVAHSASWAAGNLGVTNDIRNGHPVIVFGDMFLPNGFSGFHAIVAYGETLDSHLITNYGFPGYTNIMLKGEVIGSNAKFKLS